MTTWQLVCALYVADLVVLGPKCRTADCAEPARHRVHWPSGPFVACARCTARWREVAARGLGMHLVVEDLHYQRGGMDDAEQRFALMELDGVGVTRRASSAESR